MNKSGITHTQKSSKVKETITTFGTGQAAVFNVPLVYLSIAKIP